MQRAFVLVLMGVLGSVWAAGPAGAQEPALRVAVLTQSEGFVHDVVKPREGGSVVQQVLSAMGERHGLAVSFLDDVSQLTADRLAVTDAVVFYTTGPLPFADGQYEAFDRWVRGGGGFVGLHCATDTLKEHPTYPAMVGGVFDGHPWNADAVVALKVHDPAHPVAAPLTEPETFREEIYQFKGFDPAAVRVLASLDMARTPLKRPQHVPVSWVRRYGNGRVFYTSLGHREDVWRSDWYREHVLAGLRWAGGLIEADATPNPALHEREMDAARAASIGRPMIDPRVVGAPAVPEPRPRDPWVFRSVLDGRARMLTAALHRNLYVAYDATHASLYRVWAGGVTFQGAVYDGRHGPQPAADPEADLWREANPSPWTVIYGGGPVPAEVRFAGYHLEGNRRLVLHARGRLESGPVFELAESPEVIIEGGQATGLERRFTLSGLPEGHRLILDLTGGGREPALSLSGGGTLEPVRGGGSGTRLVLDRDGQTTLIMTWPKEDPQ